MKWLGITAIVVGLTVGLFALFTHPDAFNAKSSEITDEYSNLLYQDACVVEVTHPELQVALIEIDAPRNGCVNCRYWFRIWNQTAAVGTKAYKTSVYIVPLDHGVELNGRNIETMKLQGYVTELKTLQYPVIRNEDFFVIENLCPECLFPDQALIKVVIQYYECSGVRRYECVVNLQSLEVTILNETYEPCLDCGCN